MALAGWTLFAFAGVYPWTTVPLVAGTLILAARERPSIGRPPHRWLDGALIVWLTLAAAALIPLPPAARLAFSPAAAAVDRALWFNPPLDPLTGPARPLSWDPASTAGALILGLTFVLIFWSARAIIASHGFRETIRGIAWCGLALAVITLFQHATAPKLLYGYWHPLTPNATPFGPFVNRNDLATWLIMAIPAIVGYGVARLKSRLRSHDGPVDLESAIDATAIWLAASVCLMLATVFVAVSRSGLIGAVVGLTSLIWLSRSRMSGSSWMWFGAIMLTLITVATTYITWGVLESRLDETIATGLGGRRAVWDQTWPMVRDFRLAGVGVGAYERVMAVYQVTPHAFYINHAHNEYLQLLAEGGLILAVPAIAAFCAAGWRIARSLQSDRTPVFWIRAGATSGLVAAVVQSIWETGLRIPANAVLFAILAAVALHDSREPYRNQRGAPRTMRSA
jgi:O-antigen ligase